MAHQPTTTSINRAAFLRSLGMSAAALSALYFQGCTKSDSVVADPTDGTDSAGVAVGNTNPGTGKIDFTLDLTRPENAKLKTAGQFVTVGGVVVANTKNGTYVAISNECTHDGGPLWYRISQDDFRCPWHGGLFNTDGSVKMAPPRTAEQLYKTTLSTDKNTLYVTG
ncbi:Rieske (2Fe-2S) protein [Spirosoma spitsbergense]|uniref:Rieske (2Fe-2S) protein n=1 Tax=Spirosoma spitsbergense TaxID=431554 RepID=UPI000364E150|nr:Rieske 2Fe-2S domain-containing protein [Spirosoma spitsbergense]